MNCLKELCLLSECFLSSTRKGLRLNSKVVQESDVILFDKLSSSNVSTYESVRQAQKRKLQTPCVRPSYKNLSLEVVQVCERSWKRNISPFLSYKSGGDFFHFPVIAAEAISLFIVSQITSPSNKSFQKSINAGILKTLNYILNTNQGIVGLQVELTGRFKKSKTGRKQSSLYSYGNINTTSMATLLSFGTTSFITRFGACSLKVSICFTTFLT